MKQTISLMAGLAALLAGCAAQAPSVRTQSTSVESQVEKASPQSTEGRFDRLRELEHEPYENAVSLEGYVMTEGTKLELASAAGIYAGRVQVITDGEGHFLSEGCYSFYANSEATRKALQEADANADKIITSDEAEELSQRVFHQYAQEVSKEEFKQKVCNFEKKIRASRCDFPHARNSSRCEFDYNREKGNVEFNQHREEGDCEFNAFRNGTNSQPCKAQVAVKYQTRTEQAKNTYTACVEQSNAAFATCTAEAEKAYQQCLSGDIKNENTSSSRGRGAKVYKGALSTEGVDEEGNLFKGVYDDGK